MSDSPTLSKQERKELRLAGIDPKQADSLQATMTDKQQELFDEWLPFVMENYNWASRGQLRDPDTAVSDFVLALHHAVLTWHGSGEFNGFLRVVLRNRLYKRWRKEKKHRHAIIVVSDDVKAERGESLDVGSMIVHENNPLELMQAVGRKGFHGGDSVVVRKVIQNETQEQLRSKGKYDAMKLLGYTADDIREAKRKDGRRRKERSQKLIILEQRDQTYTRTAADFESLFQSA